MVRFRMYCLWLLWPLLLVGCGKKAANPVDPAQETAQPPLPAGENSLESLLAKPVTVLTPAPPPTLRADPESVTLSAVPVGQQASGQILLHGDQDRPLTLQAVRLLGATSGFTLAGDCREGQSVSRTVGCTAQLFYQPSRPGLSDAMLVVEAPPAPVLTVRLQASASAASVLLSSATRQRQQTADRRQEAGLQILAAATPADSTAFPTDVDYRDAGLPGLVSSFPVHRDRVLTADRYITAILETSLDSQLAGRVIAVVDRNVFGSDDRLVLIPAGSRVIGHYLGTVKAGQARIDIAWSRILRPDGAMINIDFGSADPMGRAGVPGELDSRLWEKYGSALMTSVIGAAGTWALGGDGSSVTGPLGTTQSLTPRGLAANRLGNDTDQLAQRMVTDNVDIHPVLIIPQGSRLVIVPSEDIWMRDPSHLSPVTPPKGQSIVAHAERWAQYLPALLELIAQSPAVQKVAPIAAQDVLQSDLLQQLRDGLSAGAAAGIPQPRTVPSTRSTVEDAMPSIVPGATP